MNRQKSVAGFVVCPPDWQLSAKEVRLGRVLRSKLRRGVSLGTGWGGLLSLHALPALILSECLVNLQLTSLAPPLLPL